MGGRKSEIDCERLTPSTFVPDDDFLGHLEGVVATWDGDDNDDYIDTGETEGLVRTLLAHNYNLWHLERKVREIRGDTARIAEFKASIDAENKARNRAIQRVDEEVEDRTSDSVFTSTDPGEYRLNSETVGQIIDRITILVLKRYYVKQELDRESLNDDRTAECQRRLETFGEQLDYVMTCLRDFLEALEAGNAKMLPYKEMKFYKKEDLDPKDE